MGESENITMSMVYNKLQSLENKIDEIERTLEVEHIHPITDKRAIEKLRKIDKEIADGKRKVISEEEFFCKY